MLGAKCISKVFVIRNGSAAQRVRQAVTPGGSRGAAKKKKKKNITDFIQTVTLIYN